MAQHFGNISASDNATGAIAAPGSVACLASVLGSDSPPARRGVSSSPLLGVYRVRPAPGVLNDGDISIFAGDIRLPVSESSRYVTREESISSRVPAHAPDISASREISENKAKVDWLNVTFFYPDGYLKGDDDMEDEPMDSARYMSRLTDLLDDLRGLLSRPITAMCTGGMHGFTYRWRIQAILDDGKPVEIGSICFGGASQKGRWLLQLTGKGCGAVNDWHAMRALLERLGAQITRTDLAVDFMRGEFSVDDIVAKHEVGQFINRGRNPELDTQGSWHASGKEGRTVYIGKLRNGKMLCAYEKGKELNDMNNPDWTRYEVRLGNKDRVVPLDVLTNPDKYFSGAYPALAGCLDAAAESIPTLRAEGEAVLGGLLYHAQRCYGKALNQALNATGCTYEELLEEIRAEGVPGRLDPATLNAGIDWMTVKGQVSDFRGMMQ